MSTWSIIKTNNTKKKLDQYNFMANKTRHNNWPNIEFIRVNPSPKFNCQIDYIIFQSLRLVQYPPKGYAEAAVQKLS